MRPDSKAGLLLQAFHELIADGEMGVNVPGGQVYVERGKAAVVVPVAIDLARDRLKRREIKLPSNNDLYDILRNARLVDADETGRSVQIGRASVGKEWRSRWAPKHEIENDRTTRHDGAE